MSSSIRAIKICEYCKQEFVARKMTSRTCSDPCAKRLYKLGQRQKTISQVEIETMVKRKPEAFITEEQVKTIQAKEWLTLKEGVPPGSLKLGWGDRNIFTVYQHVSICKKEIHYSQSAM